MIISCPIFDIGKMDGTRRWRYESWLGMCCRHQLPIVMPPLTGQSRGGGPPWGFVVEGVKFLSQMGALRAIKHSLPRYNKWLIHHAHRDPTGPMWLTVKAVLYISVERMFLIGVTVIRALWLMKYMKLESPTPCFLLFLLISYILL